MQQFTLLLLMLLSMALAAAGDPADCGVPDVRCRRQGLKKGVISFCLEKSAKHTCTDRYYRSQRYCPISKKCGCCVPKKEAAVTLTTARNDDDVVVVTNFSEAAVTLSTARNDDDVVVVTNFPEVAVTLSTARNDNDVVVVPNFPEAAVTLSTARNDDDVVVVTNFPEAAVTLSTARNDDGVVVVTTFSQQDINSISTTSKYEGPQCSSEGRFADPQDCGLYYDCVPSHNGGFVAHQQSCFGHGFDPTLKACVAREMVIGCLPYRMRSISLKNIPVAGPKVQPLCSNTENNFLCTDCRTLTICIDGNPYIQPCEHDRVCSMKTSFTGGVCYPGDPVECTCKKADILRQDFYNPSKFLSCDSEGSDPIVHSCPEGLIFNEQHRACITEFESSCTESGTFAIKDDCTTYYTCIFTTEGWFHKEFTCRDKTMFNEETGRCEDPCDWYSGQFTCEEEGRFANPADCTKFYVCIADPFNSTRLSSVERECPEGYEWSQMVKRIAGHCVPSVTGKEICLPALNPNKCQIPKEWCTPETTTIKATTIETTTSEVPTTTLPRPVQEVNFLTAGGEAKTTSYWGAGHEAIKGFAGYTGYPWHSNGASTLPQSIWYEFPQRMRVVKYSFQARTDTCCRNQIIPRGPSRYDFWASNNIDCGNSEARVILHQDNSNTPFTLENIPKVEDVVNPKSYRCYGFTITETPENQLTQMSNIRFYVIPSAVCSPICLNGECTSPNTCKCDEGWSGNHCQTKDWPLGNYGLPMPKSGCPPTSSLSSWSTGYRFHDTANGGPRNAWSPGLHLYGDLQVNDMYQHFCMKTDSNTSHGSWPSGQYCIFKYISCPSGFEEGYIYWDDVNNANANRISGIVPSGVYDDNTKIEFCCKIDGSHTSSIRLPTEKPFFLFRYGDECQSVHGMSYSKEFFYWDADDDTQGCYGNGYHPDSIFAKDVQVEYCYYY